MGGVELLGLTVLTVYGEPEVGGAGVEVYREGLRRGADGEVAVVEDIHRAGDVVG